MNIMDLSSAEKRREENIRKNREFQMQIGLTRIAENDEAVSYTHLTLPTIYSV